LELDVLTTPSSSPAVLPDGRGGHDEGWSSPARASGPAASGQCRRRRRRRDLSATARSRPSLPSLPLRSLLTSTLVSPRHGHQLSPARLASGCVVGTSSLPRPVRSDANHAPAVSPSPASQARSGWQSGTRRCRPRRRTRSSRTSPSSCSRAGRACPTSSNTRVRHPVCGGPSSERRDEVGSARSSDLGARRSSLVASVGRPVSRLLTCRSPFSHRTPPGDKVVYRRYASLFFVAGIAPGDNELATLEIIHRYVEILDRYFGNVSGQHSVLARRGPALDYGPASHEKRALADARAMDATSPLPTPGLRARPHLQLPESLCRASFLTRHGTYVFAIPR
jgi:hypothetical protein